MSSAPHNIVKGEQIGRVHWPQGVHNKINVREVIITRQQTEYNTGTASV